MTINPRHKNLLEELPKTNYKVRPAAIKAGYSKSYANSHPKRILKAALKAQATEVLETIESKPINPSAAKQTLRELIGLSKDELQNTLKKIALNDRDYASALKVLSVIAKNDLGFNINPDDGPKVTVPILNIGVRQTEPLIDGSTEPPIDQ